MYLEQHSCKAAWETPAGKHDPAQCPCMCLMAGGDSLTPKTRARGWRCLFHLRSVTKEAMLLTFLSRGTEDLGSELLSLLLLFPVVITQTE